MSPRNFNYYQTIKIVTEIEPDDPLFSQLETKIFHHSHASTAAQFALIFCLSELIYFNFFCLL